jgi:8-oxo-dGTP pyrophosphatase MutT (NUDIX family)
MAWITKSTEIIIQNRYVTVKKNGVTLLDGTEISDFYTVTIPDASGVVAITKEGKVLLKSEYRYSQGEDLIEIPAGVFEPEENNIENKAEAALKVAKRELLEETGFSSDDWLYLGPTVESSSKLTGKMHLFLATGCERTSTQHLDRGEVMDVFEVSLEEAVDMVMDGRIRCNSSAHAILMTARILDENK